MRKIIWLILLIFFTGCASVNYFYNPYFAPEEIITKAERHNVSIVVYYFMSPEEYNRRMQQMVRNVLRTPINSDKKWLGLPTKIIAYLGAGTILKDNYIISVKHLFNRDENTYDKKIWIVREGMKEFVETELIAVSESNLDKEFQNDYAVIKAKKDLGVEGIKISKTEIKKGEKVIFTGSLNGSSFFTRFGYATTFKWFYRKDENGKLHLSHWVGYKFITVYPGGAGDSGGGIIDINGNLVGIMYCGVNMNDENYVFSNPISMLWDFLKKHHLEDIGQ